jgi:ribonuclease P protein component
MLPKANRLKKEKDFSKVLRSNKKIKKDFLVLKLAGNDLKEVRLGISVSKKVSKKASARNKIKRRLAALLKSNLTEFKNGTDAVLIVLPGFEKKDFSGMKEAVENILEKING